MIRISKPPVNIREKLSELERPIGVKGSELMRAETLQDARDFISAGRKNMVINGNLSVWQRGTSVNVPVDSFQWCADRFWIYNPFGSGTVQRSTDAPTGFLYSMHNNSTASCSFGSNVELLTTGNSYPFVKNEWLTLSFYAKSSSNSSSTVFFSYRDTSTGYGNVPVASNFSRSFQYTTSWQKVTISIQIDADPSVNNKMFQFEFGLPPGGKVTGFQLERGKNATDFEYRSIGEELVLCQRYCQYLGGPSTGRIAIGNWNGPTGAVVTSFLFTEMRTTPTIHSYTSGNCLVETVAWYSVGTVTITESTKYTVSFSLNSIANSGQSVNANAVWGNGASVVLTAEL